MHSESKYHDTENVTLYSKNVFKLYTYYIQCKVRYLESHGTLFLYAFMFQCNGLLITYTGRR